MLWAVLGVVLLAVALRLVAEGLVVCAGLALGFVRRSTLPLVGTSAANSTEDPEGSDERVEPQPPDSEES